MSLGFVCQFRAQGLNQAHRLLVSGAPLTQPSSCYVSCVLVYCSGGGKPCGRAAVPSEPHQHGVIDRQGGCSLVYTLILKSNCSSPI